MKKGLLFFDFMVQAFFLTIILVSFLAVPLTLEFLVFSLWGGLMLGAWQLSSSLLKSLVLPGRLHGYYLVSAIGYLALLVSRISLPDHSFLNIQALEHLRNLAIWVPAIFGAVWYTRQSWKDWQQALQSNPPVFV